jgi:signal transduction histidine kinase
MCVCFVCKHFFVPSTNCFFLFFLSFLLFFLFFLFFLLFFLFFLCRLKQRDLFLRFLSHEIRTPLNIISIGLTLAQMEMTAMAGATEDALSSLEDSMGALHVAEGR